MNMIRLPSVLMATGLSRSTIYSMIKEARFPESVKIGKRAVAWRDCDVTAWIDARGSSPVGQQQ